MFTKKSNIIILFILLLFPVICNAGNMLHLLDYDISQYPIVKSHFFEFQNSIIPNTNLSPSDLIVKDNGEPIPLIDLSNPQQNPFSDISLTISFDLAMSDRGGDSSNFNLAKLTALEIIKKIPAIGIECAVTSFDIYAYINQEFTADKTRLFTSILDFQPSKSSDYNTAFLTYPTGALNVVADGKYEKSIVIITDRKTIVDADSIISLARKNKTRIYIINVGYDVQEFFKKIADSTGGKYFKQVKGKRDFEQIVSSILAYAYNYKPVVVAYRSDANCQDKHIYSVSVPKDTASDWISAMMSDDIKPKLKLDPRYLAFSAVLPGISKELDVILTAENSDIIITGLSLNQPAFSISEGGLTPQKPMITIPINKSYKIKIKYTPLDSTIVFDSLSIVSNACFGSKVLITGGFPNKKPNEFSLKIISPVCSQTMVVGDTAIVTWTGLLPSDIIQLEYSTDNGGSWSILQENVSGLEYKWKIPDKVTDKVKIRAIQLWPNNVGETLNLRHKLGVNSANFNIIGDQVITAGNDKVAKIWNSNSEIALDTLVAHTQPIRWACFSPNDKFAVTASDDSTAILWDIKSHPHQIEYILKGHNSSVKSANFSPDGKYLVTAGFDGYAIVWSVASGSKISKLDCRPSNLWFASYSPDGKSILTCGNNGHVKLWDAISFKAKFSLKISTVDNILMASFSPLGDKLVTAGWLGKAMVWDLAKRDTIFSVSHSEIPGEIPLNSASFDYSGELILTSGVDKTAQLWDGLTGKHLKTLVEHNLAVQTAVFNFDGARILTAGWDSTAKIWNLNKRDLQSDTTKCTMQIARASAECFDIDMGKAIIDESSYKLIDTLILSYSPFKFNVKDIRITGKNASDFSIVSAKPPIVVDSLGVIPIELVFKPSEIGFREANIEVVLPNEVIIRNLTGEGYKPGLLSISDYIDFGKVEIGDYIDSSFSFIVKNRSSVPINISKVEIRGPDDNHFDIISGSEPFTLQGYGTHGMTLRFTPEEIARKTGQIVFIHDGPGEVCKIILSGEGVPQIIDSITVSLPTFSAVPGEITEVPVIIKNIGSSGIRKSITGLKADVRFNMSLLEPLDYTVQSTFIGDDRIISFTLPTVFSTDSILTTLRFKAALGNDTITSLKFESIVPVGNGRIVINKEDGLFKLNGVCKEGGERLFEAKGKLSLAQNRPNPAGNNTSLEFEVIENGSTKLYIMDMTGRIVKTVFEKTLSRGVYSINMDLGDLPSGVYYYILQTPSERICNRMEVKR